MIKISVILWKRLGAVIACNLGECAYVYFGGNHLSSGMATEIHPYLFNVLHIIVWYFIHIYVLDLQGHAP